jgi:hypothetical protein
VHLRHETNLLSKYSTPLPFWTCSKNDNEELCFLKNNLAFDTIL